MKRVFYTGSEPTLHVKAGKLMPGLNEISRDDVADQLLAAGALTGEFLPEPPEPPPPDTRPVDDEAARSRGRGREKKEK